jgi:uncharacterized protein YyaL (SSP411 family)
MFFNVENRMIDYGSGYSNWALLMMDILENNYEVVIYGEEALSKLKLLQKEYYPNVIWAGSESANENFSFLKSRFITGNTFIYVCENNTCQLPVKSIAEAKKLLISFDN